MSLDGKTVLIIGEKNSITEALCEEFLSARARKLLIMTHAPEAEGTSGWRDEGKVMTGSCDMRDPASVQGAFSLLEKTGNAPDAVIFCALWDDGHRGIEDTDDVLWDKVISSNQTAAFYCSRCAAQQMSPRGSGVLLFITSTAAICAASGTAYACAAHGLISMCKNIAILFSASGIRCNTICAGPVEGMRWCTSDQIAHQDAFGRKMAEHVDTQLPPVTPKELARAALFFISDDASAINGQWLQIDRGYAC